jgi:hypothetical protein
MQKVFSLFLWAVLSTSVVGCKCGSSESKQPAAAPVSAPGAEQVSAAISAAPEDPNACRAPMEPGCNPCCEQQTDGSCAVKSWNPGPLPEQELAGITPWYNASEFMEGACPGQCRPCARCSQRAAEEFQQLGKRPECDCSQPAARDACRDRDSCGCYCSKFKALSMACPKLVPQQGAPPKP